MPAATKKKTTTTKTAKKKTKKETPKILLIVESPSKAKTIGKYLGSKYKVIASVGHVRDLPKSKLGIDIENNFEPGYISIRGKGDVIKELKKEAKKASKVYLATDPDREGEAISWHIAYLLDIDPESPCRVTFNEITKKAVKEAVKNPRPINMGLVDAQQARRLLDRLVGYQISPLLWRKIRRGLSAGRVQSAALKMICDREREIESFVAEEFWNISALFDKSDDFEAKLTHYKDKKITVRNKEENDAIIAELESGKFIVDSVKKRERRVSPYAPFTTSSLQQEAANRFSFTAKKTMSVAQQLYEGINIRGRGMTGLITYLRTDSVRISDDAKNAAKDFISEKYGSEYTANNVYSNKKKDIQDAHEAIRPTIVDLTADSIKDSLSPDQYKLYSLIWNRFVASQMAKAVYDGMTVIIKNGEYTFKATGSELKFDGFRKVYSPYKDVSTEKLFLKPDEGEELKAASIKGEQSFTQPPGRFTEASLIKELEDKNIGRPSTYAPIVSTISGRRYVEKVQKALKPTELGFLVNEVMEAHFQDIVDAGFTSEMEDRLDDIERQKLHWKNVVSEFYTPFSEELEAADKAIEKIEIPDKPTDEVCEKCGRPMVIKTGRFGEFLACTGYPECKNTRTIVKKIGVKCPACGKDIVVRRSRRGRIFYGCSGYPECKTVFWNKPIDEKCPKCGSILLEKKSKDSEIICSNPDCKYKR
jgi:DNA topoisomerase-1